MKDIDLIRELMDERMLRDDEKEEEKSIEEAEVARGLSQSDRRSDEKICGDEGNGNAS